MCAPIDEEVWILETMESIARDRGELAEFNDYLRAVKGEAPKELRSNP